MIVVGALLLVLGWLLNIDVLWVVGVVVLAVGAIFWLLGMMGRPVAGRRSWY